MPMEWVAERAEKRDNDDEVCGLGGFGISYLYQDSIDHDHVPAEVDSIIICT